MGQVAEKTLTAAIPSYTTILELDAKVREFPIPEFPKDMPMDPRKPSTDYHVSTNRGSGNHKGNVSTSPKSGFTKPTTHPTSREVAYPDVLPGGFQPGKKTMLF